MKIVNRFTPRPRDKATSREEKDISGQLVRLIDVLFALVIVQGALFYRPLFAAHGQRNAPTIIALALIMYTVVRSFVDWHILMESAPYQIVTSYRPSFSRRWSRRMQVRTLELWRLYADFLIVAAYSVLLLRAHVLLSDPAAALRFFFWTFPAIFCLYLMWGELLRHASRGRQQFREGLLLIVLGVSVVLAIAYHVTANEHTFSGYGTARNVVGLLIEAGIMVVYRHFNWKQQKTIADPLEPAPSGPVER